MSSNFIGSAGIINNHGSRGREDGRHCTIAEMEVKIHYYAYFVVFELIIRAFRDD